MHYTGTVWRPPYEASSLLLEVTAGCTHHKCKICTLYDDIPFKFRMTPLEDIESDLKETKGNFRLWTSHNVTRTFLVGANPFVLKASRLLEIELRTLVENLNSSVLFAAGGASNAIPIQGTLPGDKEKVLSVLDQIIKSVDEDELRNYRKNLRHL